MNAELIINSLKTGAPPVPLAAKTMIYPNPAQEGCTLDIFSAGDARAEISLMNLQGKVVAHLFSGPLANGKNKITWDGTASGSRVQPGLYLLRLKDQAGSHYLRLIVE